jgi:hypothetical protein
MAAKRSPGAGTGQGPAKRRQALYIAVMAAIIAVPALLIFLRLARLAEPFLNQPTGVIVKPVFLERQSDYFVYDPQIGHVHRPNVRIDVPWKEHPEGHLVMQTNNLGFREDRDTEEKKADDTIRILVTGDSHIDGVLDNSESFPSRLEALLNASGGGERYEVINGGTGFYGPQHYSRFIEKYDYLGPDVYIVVVFTGNDFLDAIRVESQQDSAIAAGRELGTWSRLVYFGRLAAARRVCYGGTGQELNQVYFFKRFPEMKDLSLAITERELARTRDRCRSDSIDLYVVLLPTHRFVEGRDTGGAFKAARLIMGLSAADLRVTREMTDSLSVWLQREGFDYIDLKDLGPAHPEGPLFWHEDSHLNTYGHRLLAERVYGAFDWPYR